MEKLMKNFIKTFDDLHFLDIMKFFGRAISPNFISQGKRPHKRMTAPLRFVSSTWEDEKHGTPSILRFSRETLYP